jgi:hypothetical protein
VRACHLLHCSGLRAVLDAGYFTRTMQKVATAGTASGRGRAEAAMIQPNERFHQNRARTRTRTRAGGDRILASGIWEGGRSSDQRPVTGGRADPASSIRAGGGSCILYLASCIRAGGGSGIVTCEGHRASPEPRHTPCIGYIPVLSSLSHCVRQRCALCGWIGGGQRKTAGVAQG